MDSRGSAPQGAVLSPLLSNVYLDPLDHLLAERGYEMVRYADDFVILCRTADDAAQPWKSLGNGWPKTDSPCTRRRRESSTRGR